MSGPYRTDSLADLAAVQDLERRNDELRDEIIFLKQKLELVEKQTEVLEDTVKVLRETVSNQKKHIGLLKEHRNQLSRQVENEKLLPL